MTRTTTTIGAGTDGAGIAALFEIGAPAGADGPAQAGFEALLAALAGIGSEAGAASGGVAVVGDAAPVDGEATPDAPPADTDTATVVAALAAATVPAAAALPAPPPVAPATPAAGSGASVALVVAPPALATSPTGPASRQLAAPADGESPGPVAASAPGTSASSTAGAPGPTTASAPPPAETAPVAPAAVGIVSTHEEREPGRRATGDGETAAGVVRPAGVEGRSAPSSLSSAPEAGPAPDAALATPERVGAGTPERPPAPDARVGAGASERPGLDSLPAPDGRAAGGDGDPGAARPGTGPGRARAAAPGRDATPRGFDVPAPPPAPHASERTPPLSARPADAPAPPDVEHVLRLASLRPAAVRDGGEMRLEVNPEGLGPVEVRVVVRAEGVQAQLTANQDHARQALEQHRPALEAALERAQLRLDAFTVDVGHQRHDGSGGWGGSPRPAAAPAAPVPTPVPAAAGHDPVVPAGGLSVRA